MIVAMQNEATEENIQQVIERMVELGFNVHRTTGATQTILAGVGTPDHFEVTEFKVLSGVYDAYRNTTEIVMGARRLRESEARLKLATDVAKLGVFVWHVPEDRASWENDQMYEIFGRTREDGPVNGTAFIHEVVHSEDREAFRQAIEATLQTGEKFRFEGRICLPDKTLRWIEVNGQHAFLRDEGVRYDAELARDMFGLALSLFHRTLAVGAQ